jgi:hypothetical protein
MKTAACLVILLSLFSAWAEATEPLPSTPANPDVKTAADWIALARAEAHGEKLSGLYSRLLVIQTMAAIGEGQDIWAFVGESQFWPSNCIEYVVRGYAVRADADAIRGVLAKFKEEEGVCDLGRRTAVFELARRGHYEAARSFALEFTAADARDVALCSLACGQALHGEFADALVTAARYPKTNHGDRVVAEVARAQAASGQFAAARQTTEKITYQDGFFDQQRVLRDIEEIESSTLARKARSELLGAAEGVAPLPDDLFIGVREGLIKALKALQVAAKDTPEYKKALADAEAAMKQDRVYKERNASIGWAWLALVQAALGDTNGFIASADKCAEYGNNDPQSKDFFHGSLAPTLVAVLVRRGQIDKAFQYLARVPYEDAAWPMARAIGHTMVREGRSQDLARRTREVKDQTCRVFLYTAAAEAMIK